MIRSDTQDKVIVIGAGPAGCSCALWLAQKNITSTIIERAPHAFPLLHQLRLKQSWVLGFPDTSTAEIAQHFNQHIQQTENIRLVLNQSCLDFEKLGIKEKRIVLADGTRVSGSALVIATGLRARHPEKYFQNASRNQPLDAIALTHLRNSICQQRVLLMGGGDNAVENALFLDNLGNKVTLWARDSLRAQGELVYQLRDKTSIEVRIQEPLPNKLVFTANHQWETVSPQFGLEKFDQVAVLFGFEPEDSFWHNMLSSEAWANEGMVSLELSNHNQLAKHGIFLAGDISQRLHPCIQTALGDGISASLQVTQWLKSQFGQNTCAPIFQTER